MGDTTPVQCERILTADCKVSLQRSQSLFASRSWSPWFDIQSDVKQGCTMSAWLFNLYFDSGFQIVKQSDVGLKQK